MEKEFVILVNKCKNYKMMTESIFEFTIIGSYTLEIAEDSTL